MSSPAPIRDGSRDNLLRAFEAFQLQSQKLEESHRALQEQIREVKERLTSVLSAIADAVFLVDPAGRILTANSAALALFGAGREEELPPLSTALPSLAAPLAAAATLRDHEVHAPINGEDRIFLASLIPLHGAEPRSVAVLHDLTEYRSLQERSGRDERLRSLGQVAASVAHEIRNPLAAVEGFARLLERDLGDNQKRMAGKIVMATRQLDSVVTNLLHYTRQRGLSPFPADLCQVIAEAAELAVPMAKDRGIDFDIEAPETLSCVIDAHQIRQILLNLFINAVQACPVRDGGRVQIRAKKKRGGLLVVEVEDNGCGIPEAKLGRLFEPFFTTKDGGIGLGLAMSRRIADAHAGTIKVRSREGEGSVFTLEIPSKGPKP
ncbi:MAG: hypothetical protein RL095_2889 [Verrucomicrobiota bacterium]|jgi:signal transduction histidine kinase